MYGQKVFAWSDIYQLFVNLNSLAKRNELLAPKAKNNDIHCSLYNSSNIYK